MFVLPGRDLPEGYDPRTEPWYVGAKQKGGIYWTDIYIDVSTGKPIVTVAAPVYSPSGMFLGVVGLDLSLEKMGELVKEYYVDKGTYAYILDRNGVIIAHPDESVLGKMPLS